MNVTKTKATPDSSKKLFDQIFPPCLKFAVIVSKCFACDICSLKRTTRDPFQLMYTKLNANYQDKMQKSS